MTSLCKIQQQFASAVRDSSSEVPAGIAPDRLAVYRELVMNNVANFVLSTFPVLRQLCQPEVFEQKIRLFFQQSQLDSPYFIEIPEAFLQWLPSNTDNLPPFALELAHYEWLELDLYRRQIPNDWVGGCVGLTGTLQTEQLLGRRIELSPLLDVAAYQYPVHQLSTSYQPTTPPAQPTFLAVYRGQDDQVHFMQLDALSCATIQLLQSGEQNVPDLVDTLLALTPSLTGKDIQSGVLKLLQQLNQAALLRFW